MNDIIENNTTYEFIAEFDDNTENDWESRKNFVEQIDSSKTVNFYESYKNVLRYINDEFIVVCEDYRYGFGVAHNIGELILYVDKVQVFKIKC